MAYNTLDWYNTSASCAPASNAEILRLGSKCMTEKLIRIRSLHGVEGMATERKKVGNRGRK